MILVAGGTGHLGVELVPMLADGGHAVRVLTRNPEHARQLLGDRAEFVSGDVRDPASLREALAGVDAVVSAVTGFGPGGPGPRAVDLEGNRNLIAAAESAGARRFVMLSMRGAAADHPMLLLRMKHAAEQLLRASRLDWTIIRPTVFMELWAGLVGDPILRSGKTVIFGRGENPVNFVSVRDLARVVAEAVTGPGFSRQSLDLGGPEDLTFRQLVGLYESRLGRKAVVRSVPVPALRVARAVLGVLRPDVAGMIEAGIATDTTDMRFDFAELRGRFREAEFTRMAEVVAARCG